MKTIKEIYDYREMIFTLVRRELRGKYKASVLGFLWTFINPLLQLLVYTLVFSVIMRNGIEQYYLFLFVALIPWLFFSTSISAGCNCVVGSADLVKKIYFPREVLPIYFVLAQLVNMLLCSVIVFAALAVSGKGFNPVALCFLPIVVIVEFILCLGMCMLFSALTVYLRDLMHILGIVTMAWQFLTPIMYSEEMVPDRLLPIFHLNPMTSVINAYRDILYYKVVPDVRTLTEAVVLGVIFLIIGSVVFHHLQKHFAENL